MRQILITYLDEVVLCFELLYDLKKLRGFNVFLLILLQSHHIRFSIPFSVANN